MMPAMSPLITEGTITRWKIKEGDAFAPGDVLLQIVHIFHLLFFISNIEIALYVCRSLRSPQSMLKLTALAFWARFWFVFFSYLSVACRNIK